MHQPHGKIELLFFSGKSFSCFYQYRCQRPEDIHAEWPDILAGRVSGRENDAERIVYIALGIWGEYATLLPGVYGRARKNGLGQVIDLLGTRTPHPQKRSDSQ